MATITFERNNGTIAAPNWVAWGVRMVFSGSATVHTTPINTTTWQDGTHSTDGDPGNDACGSGPNSGHNNNVKFISTTTMSVNGGAVEAISDTSLAEAECTCRIHLNNAVSVQTQNSFLFNFDGVTDTAEAVGVETYAFERGVAATAWTLINDDSAGIGGDNAGERLDLGEKGPGTDLYWYLALSSRGESAGAKTSHDFKIRTEIF